jgi:hypothetical protein
MKKNFLITLLVIFSFTSCENTEDLTIQVKDSISKELPKKNLNLLGLETEIINLDLVKKGDNEYVGVLTTNEFRKKGSKYYNLEDTTDNNFHFEYDVYVISDGKKFQYEIKDKRIKN